MASKTIGRYSSYSSLLHLPIKLSKDHGPEARENEKRATGLLLEFLCHHMIDESRALWWIQPAVSR